tara:strand:- start:321 stop:782 length:462 start_codon:yes stop_codon:yes gene_type:complete
VALRRNKVGGLFITRFQQLHTYKTLITQKFLVYYYIWILYGKGSFNKKAMQENFNEPEENEGMTLQEKMELEQMIVDAAFRNSFKIITGRKTLSELLESKSEDPTKMQAICAHEPGEEMKIEALENMMFYFEDEEEYEKCAEIRDIINVRIQS